MHPTPKAWVEDVGPLAKTKRLHDLRPIAFQVDHCSPKKRGVGLVRSPNFVVAEGRACVRCGWPLAFRKGVETPSEQIPHDRQRTP